MGTGLIASGGVMLLITTGVITLGALVVPVFLVVTGCALLRRAFLPDGREVFVFGGTLASLAGVFLILQRSVLSRTELRTLWPVFMTFGGVSLVAYGLKRGKQYRFSMVLPGAAIIAISLLFLLFSLNIIEQSLASLTVRWWPLVLLPPGLLMLLPGHDRS